MPPGRACPVCGRMFGTASLEIHIPQCQTKTVARWKNDPDTRDRPLPPGLASMAFGGGGGGNRRAPSSGVGASGRNVPGGYQLPSGPSNLASKFGGGGGGFGASVFDNQSAMAGRGGRGGGGGNATMMMQATSVPLNLVQCRYCERNFSCDRIGKHEGVCIGSKRARAAFDTKAQRLADFAGELMPSRSVGGARRTGPGASKYAPKMTTTSSYSSSPASYAPKRDWRREHEEFQAAIRAAKTDTRSSNSNYNNYSRQQQQQQGPSSRSSYGGATRTMGNNSRTGGGGGYPGMSGMGGGGGGGGGATRTSSSRMTTQISSSGGGAPRGAGFVGRQPAPRTGSARAGVNSSALSGASRYGGGGGGGGGGSSSSGGGFRDMSSGAGIGAKQTGILPTNDTSAGMWAAMGRDQPTYGSYGAIGSRGPRRAGAGGGGGGGGSTGFW